HVRPEVEAGLRGHLAERVAVRVERGRAGAAHHARIGALVVGRARDDAHGQDLGVGAQRVEVPERAGVGVPGGAVPVAGPAADAGVFAGDAARVVLVALAALEVGNL